jgi:hypothetical protein
MGGLVSYSSAGLSVFSSESNDFAYVYAMDRLTPAVLGYSNVHLANFRHSLVAVRMDQPSALMDMSEQHLSIQKLVRSPGVRSCSGTVEHCRQTIGELDHFGD